MPLAKLTCSYCKTSFFRSRGHANETFKLGREPYCSNACLAKSRYRKISVICENPKCKKEFKRRPGSISSHNYCSLSCATVINNTKYPKHPGIRKACSFCGKQFVSREKYCSRICKDKGSSIPKDILINEIKNFYNIHNRIPLKREFESYHAIRGRFGTWNNAIIAAGFDPNPVLFSKKHIAKDGHKCDSLAERIIDDFLFRRGIIHERSVLYPGDKGLTVDFKIKDYWIEFFGLAGERKRYDVLRDLKIKLAKERNLKLISIYPKHLYQVGKLDEIFRPLLS